MYFTRVNLLPAKPIDTNEIQSSKNSALFHKLFEVFQKAYMFTRFLKFVAHSENWIGVFELQRLEKQVGKITLTTWNFRENRYSCDGSDLSERRKENVVEKSRILVVAEETFVTSQIFEIERLEGKEQRGEISLAKLTCLSMAEEHRGLSRILLAK